MCVLLKRKKAESEAQRGKPKGALEMMMGDHCIFRFFPPSSFAEKHLCLVKSREASPRRIGRWRPLLPSRKMPASEKDVAKDNGQGVVPVPADGENHNLLLTITGLSHPPPKLCLVAVALLCVLRVWRALVRRLLACMNVTCLCNTLIVCIGA